MNRAEIQPYHIAKRYKCNLCDRLEKVEKRLVIWQDSQVVGDLLLCRPCLDALLQIIECEEEVIEEWNFKGGYNNGQSFTTGE